MALRVKENSRSVFRVNEPLKFNDNSICFTNFTILKKMFFSINNREFSVNHYSHDILKKFRDKNETTFCTREFQRNYVKDVKYHLN